jgi:hypothetical protein
MFIRRANLYSLWARKPSAVAGNLSQEARKMDVCGDDMFDLGSVGLAMGPFPLEDTLSMKVACNMLRKSLDPDKWEECLQ